jgi:3-deoxy-D-manno-octulosonate 8-phosphate phosphatase (KDO 8-P phosphatase)
MILPKLVFTDIDGVWTDGGMYYDENKSEFKKFNTQDSAGVLFLRYMNIPTIIITGENTNIVKRRAEKLKIDEVYLGIKNKLGVAKEVCTKYNVKLDEVAYIGDDINDIELLRNVGLSGAPQNAPFYIKDIVEMVTEKSGGEGAFREFVERIIMRHSSMEAVIMDYLKEGKSDFNQ